MIAELLRDGRRALLNPEPANRFRYRRTDLSPLGVLRRLEMRDEQSLTTGGEADTRHHDDSFVPWLAPGWSVARPSTCASGLRRTSAIVRNNSGRHRRARAGIAPPTPGHPRVGRHGQNLGAGVRDHEPPHIVIVPLPTAGAPGRMQIGDAEVLG